MEIKLSLGKLFKHEIMKYFNKCLEIVQNWKEHFKYITGPLIKKGIIKAIGYNDGSIVESEAHETATDAKKLVLKLENSVKKAGDIAIVTCYTTDSKGRFVPTASPEVEFFTNSSGKIIGTGSDVSDHTPVPCRTRKMREGYISVAVGVETSNGKYPESIGIVELYATSPGLDSAKISIMFE